eukprot:Gb_26515 [translate_table: standard]
MTDTQSASSIRNDISSDKRSNKYLVSCIYKTNLTGHFRFVTVTWYKNINGRRLSIAVDKPKDESILNLDIKPRYAFMGKKPARRYCLTLVYDKEIILMLGDMAKEALKRIKCLGSAMEYNLVSREDHLVGRKRFSAEAELVKNGVVHDILVECHTRQQFERQIFIRFDRQVEVHVRSLAWKFRGNQTVGMDGVRVHIFWDAHDWIFKPSGNGHAMFIFKVVCKADNS